MGLKMSVGYHAHFCYPHIEERVYASRLVVGCYSNGIGIGGM